MQPTISVLLAALVMHPGGVPNHWMRATIEQGGFTVHMPGVPTLVKTQTFRTPRGRLRMHVLSLPLDGRFFSVCYTDASREYHLAPPEQVFMDARRAFLHVLPGRILRDERGTINGQRREEFLLDLHGRGVVEVRVIARNGRAYLLCAGCPYSQNDFNDIARFFNSFTFLNGNHRKVVSSR